MKAFALRVGELQSVLLLGVEVEAEARHRRRKPGDDLIAELRARELIAAVRDQQVLDESRHAEQPLRRRERRQDGRPVGSGAFELDDIAHAKRRPRAPDQEVHAVTCRGAQVVGGVGVQEDFSTAEVGERD
jgi:hypothetical protein